MRSLVICILISIVTSTFADVTVFTLDNKSHKGKITKFSNDNKAKITLSSRETVEEIFCEDIVKIDFEIKDIPQKSNTSILLNNGSIVYGEIVDGNPTSLRVKSNLLGIFAIELTKIKNIYFAGDRSSELEATESDALFFKSGDKMTGLIEKFGNGYVEIQHELLGLRKEYFEKLERIHFASLEEYEIDNKNLATKIIGKDNSSIRGQIINWSNETIHFQLDYLESEIAIPLDNIKYAFFVNGRFNYLSDLPPKKWQVSYSPYFPNSQYQVTLDKNQLGNPMQLKGKFFYKGIGTISNTQISVDLNREYKKFQCYIGIDDVVAKISQHNPYIMGGNAIFRVILDGKQVAQHGVLNTSSDLVALDIDVTNVDNMKLVVDAANNGNVNDLANWAGAILIK